MKITYKLDKEKGAFVPVKAHKSDAGWDLFTPFPFTILPHSRMAIDTGVHFNIPDGWRAKLYSKSGLMAKKGITCRGLIDAGYTGPIIAVLFNHSDSPYFFGVGQKITQIIFEENPDITLEETDTLEETERGSGGLGSTGA